MNGTFSEGWDYRLYTTGLTSDQSKALNMRGEDSLSFNVGDSIAAYSYKNFNVNHFTIAVKLQFYSTGQSMHIFDWYGDSDNYVSSYITSGNTVFLKYKAGGTERSVNISPTIVEGTYYCCVLRGDKDNYVDSSNYLRIDWGETSITVSGGTANALGTLASSASTFSIGQTWRRRGESCMQGRLWMWVLNYPLSTSDVSSFMSDSRNTEPICDQNTLFMMNGYKSGNYPQAIFYDSSGCTYSDTFESGVSNYTGIDATVADESSNPIADFHSMKVTAIPNGGGYSRRYFAVSANTTYNINILVKGVSGDTIGIMAVGDNSGTINYRTITANGNKQKIGLTITTGSSDSSLELRFFDTMPHIYSWGGFYSQTTNWQDGTINWNGAI